MQMSIICIYPVSILCDIIKSTALVKPRSLLGAMTPGWTLQRVTGRSPLRIDVLHSLQSRSAGPGRNERRLAVAWQHRTCCFAEVDRDVSAGAAGELSGPR